MQRYLMFTLYAPLAAMGEIAVGERRMGWSRPARSAVLGLIAAALGLDRYDEKNHQALDREYGYGVRTDRAGSPLHDYHTAQVPPESELMEGRGANRRRKTIATRRAELTAGKLQTILSTREYRVDACFTAAIWTREATATWTLNDLASALAQPRFTPYFGRRSCPFGAPFDPQIFTAGSLPAAFEQYEPFAALTAPLLPLDRERTIAADDDPNAGLPNDTRLEKRRDGVISRRRWQFSERQEKIFTSNHRGANS